jgi:hypothetical protein
MSAIDLQLERTGSSGPITAYLISPGGAQAFSSELPDRLGKAYQLWRDRFLAHHDPARQEPPADVVRTYGLRLDRELADWLQQHEWDPLNRALAQWPGLALRIRCQSGPTLLEQLPWEGLPFKRPILRLGGDAAPETCPPLRSRQPRILLVVGAENDLDLSAEIALLQALHQRGRIALRVLRGGEASLTALQGALPDPAGWDGLIVLGHSEADPDGGGRLHLGDGSWLVASAVRQELQQTAARGLPLVLLNSCSGSDLARSCTAAGIPWALCFREPVPTAAAGLAFSSLLAAMESGQGLSQAVATARRQLEQHGPADSHRLLSVFCTGGATDVQLPLRRRQQFRRRLASSRRSQAITAGLALLLGAAGELEPSNPLSTFLLDRRLYVQRLWRDFTSQGGPSGPSLPVLLLDARRMPEALGVTPTPGRVTRAALARILERIPPERVPKVALDVVLDEPAPATENLAAVIRDQARPSVLAGYFGAESDAPGAGDRSRPLPQLIEAGLKARNLTVGTVAGGGSLKPVPLQLRAPITAANFAGALSSSSMPLLPVEAVIDWSIDWSSLLRQITVADLASLQVPALLVGTDGQIDRDQSDRFQAPGAVREALPAWGGTEGVMPGSLVQAVLAQSLSLGHWLTPGSLTACTALAAGGGVLLAAAQPSRQRRLLLIGAIGLLAVPLGLQLAVGQRILVPLMLPLAALASTTLLRSD